MVSIKINVSTYTRRRGTHLTEVVLSHARLQRCVSSQHPSKAVDRLQSNQLALKQVGSCELGCNIYLMAGNLGGN